MSADTDIVERADSIIEQLYESGADNNTVAAFIRDLAAEIGRLRGEVEQARRSCQAMVHQSYKDGYADGVAPAEAKGDVLGLNATLTHNECQDAEQAYTTTVFDYTAAPVGSRDWSLYWRGWWHRAHVYTPHAVAFRYLRRLSGEVYAWTRWLGMDELHHYGADGNLVDGPAPDWKIEYAYPHPQAANPSARELGAVQP